MGCAFFEEVEYTEAIAYIEEAQPTPVTVFNTREGLLAPLEPQHGAYSGVFMPAGFSTNPMRSDIEAFEQRTSTTHSIYTYVLELGNPPPELWMLEILSLQRTPNIVLTHNQNTPLVPFNYDEIEELAKFLGHFRVPMFLHFFPEARSNGYNPADYMSFFRYARSVFREHAPLIAFVFTICEQDILDFDAFYPGDSYVDWVGMKLLLEVCPEGNPYNEGTFNRLDIFYQRFHHYKPMMVFFGVSNFSTIDHRYHPMVAGNKIQYVYSKILDYYPRIKAIVYLEINALADPIRRNNTDIFSVTSNNTTLDFFRETINGNNFVKEVSLSKNQDIASQLFRSFYSGYRIDGEIYISKNTLANDLGVDRFHLIHYLQSHEKLINNDILYPLDVLLDRGIVEVIYNSAVDSPRNFVLIALLP